MRGLFPAIFAALVALLLAGSAAAQVTPTLTLRHLGPNDVPGPYLLRVTVQHAAWVTVACDDGRIVGGGRNPFPSTPATWDVVWTTPPCDAYTITLQGVGVADATFGPFREGDGDGGVVEGRPLAPSVYLPLLRVPE